VECIDRSATDSSSCDAGAKLELLVVSDKFEGLGPLKRHRAVNDCLVELMPQIHAISIQAWTPVQYQAKLQQQQQQQQ
jgi:stress-induced morphogen